ncbi:MAG TPA: NAD(P)-dependent alcohol dehydrogenase [Actinospica sp.]|jgi:aryl-alcohol dehydrogenase|nr:NAD(P)-dependent alcohol dehydrogenase [Actinospica sp.]
MPIPTRAAVLEGAGAAFAVQDVVLDEPRADEVLVRVVAAGLCHTDLGVQAGGIPFKLPGILGHEGAGIVERVGSAVTRVAPGDKVLLSFTSCGRCASCRAGHPAYCVTWLPSNLISGVRGDGTATVTRDGGAIGGHFFGQSSFAQHALADERSVIKVDPDADLDVLAPLGCGVQTGFGSVWNILRPEAGASIAIFGSGAVGLAALMAARLLPLSTVIAVDLVPERLELARELGATHTIDATGLRPEDVLQSLFEATGGLGVDNAVETTAHPGVLRTAVDALAPRGACAVVGAPPAGTEVALDVQGLLTGKRVIGVTLGDADPETLIPHMVALHRAGRLPLERLVQHYTLDEIGQAAADMHEGRTIKPVIRLS